MLSARSALCASRVTRSYWFVMGPPLREGDAAVTRLGGFCDVYNHMRQANTGKRNTQTPPK